MHACLQRLGRRFGAEAEVEVDDHRRPGSRCPRRCRRGCSTSASWWAGSARCRRPSRSPPARPAPVRAGGSGCAPAAGRRCGPARRLTVSRPDSEPRRPFLIMSPRRCTDVGSPTMQQSSRSPRACSASHHAHGAVDRRAFFVAGDQAARRRRRAPDARARIPRPPPPSRRSRSSCRPRRGRTSWPSRCVGTKGSLRHCSSGPVGTTSVWPANTTVRARPRAAVQRPTGC